MTTPTAGPASARAAARTVIRPDAADARREPQHGNAVHRRYWRWLAVGIFAYAALVVALNLWVDPLGLTDARRFPSTENTTSRSIKADLMEALPTAPDVLITGSSTAMKFNPEAIRELSGASAFNAAVTSGKPIDAHAYAVLADELWGDDFPHLVLTVGAESFFERTLAEVGLVRDARLRSSLAPLDYARATTSAYGELLDLRTAAISVEHLIRYARDDSFRAAADRTRKLAASSLSTRANADNFAADGYYTFEYPLTQRRGFDVAFDKHMHHYLKNLYTGPAPYESPSERYQSYFERTIRLANARGDTPVVVFLPMHDKARAALSPYDHEQRRTAVLEYLAQLQQETDIAVVDLYDLSEFGGTPDGFFDGIHMKPDNTRRILRYLDDRGLLDPPGGEA